MLNLRKKERGYDMGVKGIFCSVIAAVVLWAALSFWLFGTLFIPESKSIEYRREEFTEGMKECHLDQEQYLVSESDDSWVAIQLKKRRYRILDIEIEDIVGDVGVSQIFYTNQAAFTSDSKISFQLNQGVNTVRFSGNTMISGIRLDLTDRTGVKIKVGKVSLSRFSTEEINRFCIAYIILYAVLLILMWICWKRRISLKEVYHEVMLSECKCFRFVMILVTCIFAAVYGKLLIEDVVYVYTDIGADTMNSYVPGLYAIADDLRSGRISFWNYANICGSSNISFFSNSANPFLFVVTLLGAAFGNQTIVLWLLAAQYMQIILGTYFCFKLLGLYGVSNQAKIIASVVFAFNGFQILWGQHYGFAIFTLLSIAVIYSIESYLQQKNFQKYLLIILLVAISGLVSVYMVYMILIAAGFYALFRILKKEERKVITVGKLLSAVILGMGISAVLFIPSAMDLLNNSSRLSSETGIVERFLMNLTDPYTIGQIKDISIRFLSNNLLGVANRAYSYKNYYEVPQLFFSCFSISIFMQYFFILWKKEAEKKQKILSYIIYALVLFLIFNKAGSLVFNGFVYAFGRYTFVIMPFFAIAFAITIDDMLLYGLRSYAGLAVSMIVNICLMYKAYIQMPYADKGCIQIILIINAVCMVFFVCFVIAKKSTAQVKGIYFLAFLALIVIDVFYDSYITVCHRQLLGKESYEQSQEKITTVKKIVNDIQARDHNYFRLEKTFTDFSVCDAAMEGYDGITGYNSVMNAEFAEFRDNYMPGMYLYDRYYRPKYQPIKYQFDKLGLLGVKYILSDYELPDYSTYLTLVDMQQGYYIYQNQFAQSFQQYYSEAYNYDDFIKLTYKEKTDVLKNCIVQKGISSEKHAAKSEHDVTDAVIKQETEKEKFFEQVQLDEREYLAASFYVSADDSTANITMKAYTTTGNVYDYMIQTLLQTEYYFFLPENIERIEFCGQDVSAFKVSDFKVFKDRIYDEAKVDGTLVKADSQMLGSVNMQKDGYIFLPIVYQDGWTLKVDGRSSELLRADSGFMAFYLTEGEHRYCIRYEIPGMKEGAYISIVSILCVIASGVYVKRRKAVSAK